MAIMRHAADPTTHQRAREQILEVIGQAAGYRYGLLAEQGHDPVVSEMHITAVYAPPHLQKQLEDALGLP